MGERLKYKPVYTDQDKTAVAFKETVIATRNMMKVLAAIFLIIISIDASAAGDLDSSHFLYGRWFIEDSDCPTSLTFAQPDSLIVRSGNSIAWGYFTIESFSEISKSFSIKMFIDEVNGLKACSADSPEIGEIPFFTIEQIDLNKFDLDGAFIFIRL